VAELVLIGWVPLALVLFATLPRARAALAGVILATLFLPMASITIAGLPDYDKSNATSLGLLLAVVVFDHGRLARFRFSRFDLPMLVFCTSPFATSLLNGLGLYDGCSSVMLQVLRWGVPYFVGRLYCESARDLREMAIGLVMGGMVYVPLCLWEVRMSPQLHAQVYGFHQHRFAQSRRFGGFRPVVFMQHGIMVGIWMTVTSMTALFLWRAGVLRRMFGLPMGLIVGTMLATCVLCKSLGALLLLAGGIVLMALSIRLRTRLLVFLLALLPSGYVATRVLGWSGESAVWVIETYVDPARAQSLGSRFGYEELQLEHIAQRPFFGWGRWGRDRPRSETTGQPTTITDSLWVLLMGQFGLVGMGAYLAVLGVPVFLTAARLDPARYATAAGAPAFCLAVALGVYAADKLTNGMPNPVLMFVAGGLNAFWLGGGFAGAEDELESGEDPS
jgi:hypothetical protein